MPPGVRITAIGDSVMLGASRQMAYVMGALDVDADIGRQTSTGIDLLRADLAASTVGNVVVIGLGATAASPCASSTRSWRCWDRTGQ
jgi:hypothetical protein